MTLPRFVPVRHLAVHEVDGRRRWTGRAELPGVLWRDVLILEVAGRLVAVRNLCPHRRIPITRGRFDEVACVLECPSHGWQMRLDGAELSACPVVVLEGQFHLDLEGALQIPLAPEVGNTEGAAAECTIEEEAPCRVH